MHSRHLFAITLAALLVAANGCCCGLGKSGCGIGSWGCGDWNSSHCKPVDECAESAPASCDCGSCDAGYCSKKLFCKWPNCDEYCGSGCGEIYWCDWKSDPPDLCDSCDQCGGISGGGCCPLDWCADLAHHPLKLLRCLPTIKFCGCSDCDSDDCSGGGADIPSDADVNDNEIYEDEAESYPEPPPAVETTAKRSRKRGPNARFRW